MKRFNREFIRNRAASLPLALTVILALLSGGCGSGHKPKVAREIEKKISDISTLRSNLDNKRTEINRLKGTYQKEIGYLEEEILMVKKENRIYTYGKASENRTINYDLSLIRIKKAYIQRLDEIQGRIVEGNEELLFLERKAMTDLGMVKVLGDDEAKKILESINLTIDKYLPAAGEIVIDQKDLEFTPPNQIWDDIMKREKKREEEALAQEKLKREAEERAAKEELERKLQEDAREAEELARKRDAEEKQRKEFQESIAKAEAERKAREAEKSRILKETIEKERKLFVDSRDAGKQRVRDSWNIRASFTREVGYGKSSRERPNPDMDLFIFDRVVQPGNVVTRTIPRSVYDRPMTVHSEVMRTDNAPDGYFISMQTIRPNMAYRLSINGAHAGSYPGIAGYVELREPFFISGIERKHFDNPRNNYVRIYSNRIDFCVFSPFPRCSNSVCGWIDVSVIIHRR